MIRIYDAKNDQGVSPGLVPLGENGGGLGPIAKMDSSDLLSPRNSENRQHVFDELYVDLAR